ncbi:hypothetical protein D3C81_1485470 [compost metagenome]
MGAIGGGLAAHLIALELLFRLRGAEQIGCQFGAAHVVKNLLALLQALVRMDVLRTEPAIQAFVAVILEHRVVQRRFHARLPGSDGQILVVFAHLLTQQQPALRFAQCIEVGCAGFFDALIADLGQPELERLGPRRGNRLDDTQHAFQSGAVQQLRATWRLNTQGRDQRFPTTGKRFIALAQVTQISGRIGRLRQRRHDVDHRKPPLAFMPGATNHRTFQGRQSFDCTCRLLRPFIHKHCPRPVFGPLNFKLSL